MIEKYVVILTHHIVSNPCKNHRCWLCSVFDCPFHNPEHYAKDGCPSCATSFRFAGKGDDMIIPNILRLQLTNMLKEAVIQGINDYRASGLSTIDNENEKQLLAHAIISSLGTKIETIYNVFKAGVK